MFRFVRLYSRRKETPSSKPQINKLKVFIKRGWGCRLTASKGRLTPIIPLKLIETKLGSRLLTEEPPVLKRQLGCIEKILRLLGLGGIFRS